LLQSFSLSSQEGTVTVISGNQEGYIVFSQGSLVATRVGRVTGPKALLRILRWSEGRYEFHARIDNQIVRDPPELSFSLDPRRVASQGAELGKMECAIVDLIRVGANVRKLLDVIPEADLRIHEALTVLVDLEILIPETPKS
jgi:hypothetical protein